MAAMADNKALAPGADPVLAGFEHINRYWDNGRATYAAKILPGEYYVTCAGELIVTVLGSCVSACIRDTVFGIGGMNHFMLPTHSGQSGAWDAAGLGESTRYGSYAMERLINDILKNGGRRGNLEVKVFGGGRILANMTDVGRRNIEFVKHYIETEGLRIVARDLGDVYPRKVCYAPATGKVQVLKLRSLHNNTIVERETEYQRQLAAKPVAGDVTLF
jgi:chemotaxis protein CheD